MTKSLVELVTGSLDEKRAWRQQCKRVQALPDDYRFAFKKILSYGYSFGFCFTTQSDLLALFEESASAGRPVLEVVGSNVAAFCDELMRASGAQVKCTREKLNRDIYTHFHKEEK